MNLTIRLHHAFVIPLGFRHAFFGFYPNFSLESSKHVELEFGYLQKDFGKKRTFCPKRTIFAKKLFQFTFLKKLRFSPSGALNFWLVSNVVSRKKFLFAVTLLVCSQSMLVLVSL